MAKSALKSLLNLPVFLYPLCLLVYGCQPSYPASKVSESIKQICRDEYSLAPDVNIMDGTLSVKLAMNNLIESSGTTQTGLSKEANQKINNIISVIHRVVLSTDKKFDFYALIIHDKKIPDVEFVLIRNVEDVLRANAYVISTAEFFKRSITDLRIVQNEEGRNFLEGPIVLPKFLAFQMTKRMEEDANLQAEGGFENGRFIFVLKNNAVEEGEQLEAYFLKALSEIVNVLKGYRFNDYNSIYIMYIPTKKLVDIPRQKIQLVIDKKLTLRTLLSQSL